MRDNVDKDHAMHLACWGCGDDMAVTMQEYLCGGGQYCTKCIAKSLVKSATSKGGE